MFHARVWTPCAPRVVWRFTTWLEVQAAAWGLTWTRKRTCWPAFGSVTLAEKEIWLFVHPSNWVTSGRDWNDVSGRLPVCATLVGTFGGRPKSGGVNSSPYV